MKIFNCVLAGLSTLGDTITFKSILADGHAPDGLKLDEGKPDGILVGIEDGDLDGY